MKSMAHLNKLWLKPGIRIQMWLMIGTKSPIMSNPATHQKMIFRLINRSTLTHANMIATSWRIFWLTGMVLSKKTAIGSDMNLAAGAIGKLSTMTTSQQSTTLTLTRTIFADTNKPKLNVKVGTISNSITKMVDLLLIIYQHTVTRHKWLKV